MQFLTVLCFSSEKVEDQETTRPVYCSLGDYVTGRMLNSEVTYSFPSQTTIPTKVTRRLRTALPPEYLEKQISEGEARRTGQRCARGSRRDGANLLPKASASITGETPPHHRARGEQDKIL